MLELCDGTRKVATGKGLCRVSRQHVSQPGQLSGLTCIRAYMCTCLHAACLVGCAVFGEGSGASAGSESQATSVVFVRPASPSSPGSHPRLLLVGVTLTAGLGAVRRRRALHGRASHNRGAIGGRRTPLVVGRRGMVMVAVAGVRSAMHQLLT